jgi:hypothetical protein|tara:strand:+ start:11689 stop:11979 length:291 start_codon:yes stop_codon:yes gene_type:complete
MKKDLETLMDEALQNIRDDRQIARELLNDTANLIATSPDDSRYLGPVAAKHVETLQRSNEQLVKLISITQKEASKSNLLSEEDKQDLFDIIKENNV